MAHSWERGGRAGYGTQTSRSTLRELRALGANWVSLTPFGFVRSLTSETVMHMGAREAGETDERVRAEIRAARACGHQVLLKPHLWVSGGQWRAELEPSDWTRWFASYRRWMLRYAAMAEEEEVSILAVGTELRSSLHHEALWRSLLRDVRAVYSGRIVYCANWDALDSVPFWDALDYIGVQFYAPLAMEERATQREMLASLERHLDGIGALSERHGRQVLLTEVGYKSTADTAIRPYEWAERASSRPDAQAQERAYRALFRGLHHRPWLAGVYLWKWFTDPSSTEEGPGGFSPRSKPAEAIIRRAFGGGP